MGLWKLDEFEQEQDEDDGEDKRESAAAVVAESRSHAIAAKAEQQNQDNQKDKHLIFSPFGEDSPDGGVMQILLLTRSQDLFTFDRMVRTRYPSPHPKLRKVLIR